MTLTNGRDPSKLPFPGYKWRWATLTPTESLNRPDIFVGVLRALRKNEGNPASSPALANDLRQVALDLTPTVDLVRTPERNLIRNSGQYWKVTGVLADGDGAITLTPLGRALADRSLTETAFAGRVINSLTLPSVVYSAKDRAAWAANGLQIQPLKLILQVVKLTTYLTVDELLRCVIPMAGQSASVAEHADLIIQRRMGLANVSGWQTNMVAANDRRMAREFLLFLSNYGFLVERSELNAVGSLETRYFFDSYASEAIGSLTNNSGKLPVAQVDEISEAVERVRSLREVLLRPGQSKFRRKVVAAASSTCLITGTAHPSVLEAAHIRPVSLMGSDAPSNGLCLRSDIHALYDSGHLRVHPSGAVHKSSSLNSDATYVGLPGAVTIPAYVSNAQIEWRWKYH